ncbi:MAG: hypothetical protein RSA64_00830 [Christensenellaceae bacterium]
MVIKTIVCKIHKPSKTKQQIMDGAINQYNEALDYLLKNTQKNIAQVEEEIKGGGACLSKRLTSTLDKTILNELNSFGVQPFKDALKLEYAMTMIAYLSLKKTQKNAKYPSLSIDDNAFNEAFWDMVQSYDAHQIGRKALHIQMDRAYTKFGVKKPLLFGRYAKNRDYCLLYDKENDRFYAKLYLMNVKDEHRRKNIRRSQNELVYVFYDYEKLEKDNKHERYIVVPLSFGKKQWEILKEGLGNPKIFKTARLEKKKDAYYLQINVECAVPKAKEHDTFLGLTRSLVGAAAYTICTKDGAELTHDKIKNSSDFHIIANAVVKQASKYNSQIITYKLGAIGDKLSYQGAYAHLTAGEFNKLVSMISYKAELAGLKKPVMISPRGIFYTCSQCGTNTYRNRFMQDKFLCVVCGKSGDLEKIGGMNTARKILKYNDTMLQFTAYEQGDKILLENKILKISVWQNAQRIDDFYETINQLAQEYRLKATLPKELTNKEISYMKRFMRIKDAKNEIAIIEAT